MRSGHDVRSSTHPAWVGYSAIFGLKPAKFLASPRKTALSILSFLSL